MTFPMELNVEREPEGVSASKPCVSVIVVNYNAGRLLTDCVQAALRQVREVVVVDNASADTSVAECEQVFAGNPALRVVRNACNLGFAAACNIGFGEASCEYVLFLNPDCRIEAGGVTELLAALLGDPRAGMVGGLLLNADGTEQGGGRRAVPTPWRSFVRAFGLSRFAARWPKLFFDFHLHKQPLPDRAIEVEAISGACMLVRREAVADVGLWDEAYFLHCEDLDWCMRFRRREWKIMFVPSARIEHALGACSRTRPFFVEWHKHRGMMRFYRKFFRHQYPGFLMWLVAFGVWFRFGLVSAYHLARRTFSLFRMGGRDA
jgi:GT2 family glycosyltransferase